MVDGYKELKMEGTFDEKTLIYWLQFALQLRKDSNRLDLTKLPSAVMLIIDFNQINIYQISFTKEKHIKSLMINIPLGKLTAFYKVFSTFAQFSEKLTFLTPRIRTYTCAYQGVRNVSFSENFEKVLKEWSHIRRTLIINGYQ